MDKDEIFKKILDERTKKTDTQTTSALLYRFILVVVFSILTHARLYETIMAWARTTVPHVHTIKQDD